jgi:type IV secretion system T-DNA border endonuclease VirD2
MFFLGKDHHFNYDAFRVAMVDAAQVHGIRLEATRRLDRGVTTYRAEIDEVYKAREEGRPPVERQRTGADLAAALQTVARNALTYRGLAAEASRSNFDDVAEALERASTILASGGQIQSDGAIYMSQDETAFDTLITEFSQNIRQIEAAIDRAPAAERPEIERKLTDVLASVAHLNPLGDRSAALLDAPSRDGVYARANMREDQLERLDEGDVKARLTEALQGTGIDPEAVAARMREGAGNAALERQWLAQDLRAIATAGDLDLEKGEDREEALDRLEAVHVRLGDTLTDARILRAVDDVDEAEDAEVSLAERLTPLGSDLDDAGPDAFAPSERQDFQQLVAQFRRTDFTYPFSDDPSVRRAGAVEVEEARAAFNAYAQRSPDHAELASMAWDKITDSRKPQEFAVEEKDRRLHAGDMDLALRDPMQHLGPITEDDRNRAIDAATATSDFSFRDTRDRDHDPERLPEIEDAEEPGEEHTDQRERADHDPQGAGDRIDDALQKSLYGR